MDWGDLIPIAAPDFSSNAAKQESNMAITIEDERLNQDKTANPERRQSGAARHDSSSTLSKQEPAITQRPKPGELAIVVKDDSDQLNLGVIVRVLKDIGFNRWSQWDAKRNKWGPYRPLKTSYVEAISTRGLSYHSDDCDGDLVVCRFGKIPTSYLRRVASQEQQ
jgi:hypothetical protein